MNIEIFIGNAICIAILMTILWAISVIKRDASIVDPFWSIGFGVMRLVRCISRKSSP